MRGKFLLLFLWMFLLNGFVSAYSNVANPGHGGNFTFIRVNGSNTDLQYAIDNGFLVGNIVGGGVYSGSVSFGHLGSQVLVKVNNVEKSLQQAINDSSLCSTTGNYGSYSGSISVGHYASNITILNASGVEKTLQGAIDNREFCAQQYLLRVFRNGTGIGRIRSQNVVGINCGTDCNETYSPGTIVRLNETHDNDVYAFVAWYGCDNIASNNRCNFSMSSDRNITAEFRVRPFMFSIDAGSGYSYTIRRGESINVPIGIDYIRGIKENVDLQVIGLPSGVSGSFNPDNQQPTFSSALTLTASSSASIVNDMIITVRGVSPSYTTSDTFRLSVDYPRISCPTDSSGYCEVQCSSGSASNPTSSGTSSVCSATVSGSWLTCNDLDTNSATSCQCFADCV